MYFLITERIITWTEIKSGTVTIVDIERTFHAEMAKRAQEARASKRKPGTVNAEEDER